MPVSATKTAPKEDTCSRQSTSEFAKEAVARAKMVHDWKASRSALEAYTDSYERLERRATVEKYSLPVEVRSKLSGMLTAMKENQAFAEQDDTYLEWKKIVDIQFMTMQKRLYTDEEFEHFTRSISKANSVEEMAGSDREWMFHMATKYRGTIAVDETEKKYFDFFVENMQENGIGYLMDEEILSYMFEVVNEGGIERVMMNRKPGAKSRPKAQGVASTMRR